MFPEIPPEQHWMRYYVFQVELCKSVFSFANIKKPLTTTTQSQQNNKQIPNNSNKQTNKPNPKNKEEDTGSKLEVK